MSADFSVPATGRLEKINATHACPGDPPDKFMAAGCQNKQRAENTIKYTKRCFRPAYSGSVLSSESVSAFESRRSLHESNRDHDAGTV